MTATPAPNREYDPIDVSSHAFWARPPAERERAFAELRRRRPLSWHRPAETRLLPGEDDAGFWALVSHADIVAASRNARTFRSGQDYGGTMLEDTPADVLEAAHSILSMDDPRHAKLRKLISSVFTPRRVARIRDQINAQARQIVDDLGRRREIDVVTDVSARLPMWTISEMIGIGEADRERVAEAAYAMVSWNDPEFARDGEPLDVLLNGLMTLHQVAYELVEARRAAPADDVISALAQAEVDGERLTDEEIAAFFVLLCVAGNDTTRQTTTHALLALQQHPRQRTALLADFDGRIGTAVEEFVRWASPVLTFRRTAAVDTEIRGQRITAGERVVLFYQSGNRDETVFETPERFDVSRAPNPHVGFGGGGPHFCLGSHLAKMQLRAIFEQLLHRLPAIEVGEPEYLASNFINGIKRLPALLSAGSGANGALR
jgi:cytochrome P450